MKDKIQSCARCEALPVTHRVVSEVLNLAVCRRCATEALTYHGSLGRLTVTGLLEVEGAA